MPRTTLQRVLLALLPAMVLASIAASAVWGESGLLARHGLRARLDRANDDLAALDRENQRLLRDLSVMEQDPVVLERIIAEELGWAREGSTVYRFEEEPAAAEVDPPGRPAAVLEVPAEDGRR